MKVEVYVVKLLNFARDLLLQNWQVMKIHKIKQLLQFYIDRIAINKVIFNL